MPGENRELRLDPVVDLALGGLGFFILTLFGNQLILLMARYLPETRPLLLTLAGAAAVLVGMIGRKMRRGQHDLPRLVRLLEVMAVAGLAALCHLGSGPLTMLAALAPVLILYELGYGIGDGSEELLFDFTGYASRSNWQQKWETEGYRLYDRHIHGFRRVQNLMLALDGGLVLIWLVAGPLGWWGFLGGCLLLLFQLIFVGVAFYQKKRIVWTIHGYAVDERVVTRLLGMVAVLALAVTVLAALLPVNYNPIPWKAVGDWLSSLINGKGYRTVIPSAAESYGPEPAAEEMAQQVMLEMGSGWHTWLFFGLIGALALFFLAVAVGYLLSYWNEERYRLQGFPALLVRIYRLFREMVAGWLRGLRHGFRQMKTGLERRKERRSHRKLQKLLDRVKDEQAMNWQPCNPSEEIVYLFLRVLRLFREHGCERREPQTLRDYLAQAAGQFPEVQDEIRLMGRLVEEAVYSLHIPEKTQVEVMTASVRLCEERVGGVRR